MVEVKVVKRMWRVSLAAMIAVGIFLVIRYLIRGLVPQTTELKTTGQWQIVLPFVIIAFTGVWSALMVYIFSNKAMKADYIVVDLAVGLISGLIVGLGVGWGVGYGFNLFFSLTFGLIAGIVVGLNADFDFSLIAGLAESLTVGFGLSLIFFSLPVVLYFSLAFNVAVGLVVSLKFLFKNFRPLCQKTWQWLWLAV